ncbi:hypothetical protein EDC01DRAFT_636146 [Geopyxis carbonaria]|nr:hypothetical protein EDC01DRAFT_636146 [Geopyxis carbonaria]
MPSNFHIVIAVKLLLVVNVLEWSPEFQKGVFAKPPTTQYPKPNLHLQRHTSITMFSLNFTEEPAQPVPADDLEQPADRPALEPHLRLAWELSMINVQRTPLKADDYVDEIAEVDWIQRETSTFYRKLQQNWARARIGELQVHQRSDDRSNAFGAPLEPKKYPHDWLLLSNTGRPGDSLAALQRKLYHPDAVNKALRAWSPELHVEPRQTLAATNGLTMVRTVAAVKADAEDAFRGRATKPGPSWDWDCPGDEARLALYTAYAAAHGPPYVVTHGGHILASRTFAWLERAAWQRETAAALAALRSPRHGLTAVTTKTGSLRVSLTLAADFAAQLTECARRVATVVSLAEPLFLRYVAPHRRGRMTPAHHWSQARWDALFGAETFDALAALINAPAAPDDGGSVPIVSLHLQSPRTVGEAGVLSFNTHHATFDAVEVAMWIRFCANLFMAASGMAQEVLHGLLVGENHATAHNFLERFICETEVVEYYHTLRLPPLDGRAPSPADRRGRAVARAGSRAWERAGVLRYPVGFALAGAVCYVVYPSLAHVDQEWPYYPVSDRPNAVVHSWHHPRLFLQRSILGMLLLAVYDVLYRFLVWRPYAWWQWARSPLNTAAGRYDRWPARPTDVFSDNRFTRLLFPG